jgi:tetratricopeptide (TPR) repeat protein
LYERNNTCIEKRLSVLTDHHKHVAEREDALTREILVLVLNKKYDKAIEYLENNFFHIQEGTRALHDIYVDAHLLRGILFLNKQDIEPALDDFLKADIYPENHQTGRDIGHVRNPQIYYYTGLVYEKGGDLQKAGEYFEKSVSSDKRESQYMYYQALAYKKLKNNSSADKLFEDLIGMGEKKLVQLDEIDFFSKFGEGESKQKRQASAYFIKGLGYLGKGSMKQAGEFFQKAIQLDVGHIWAKEFYDAMR